MTNDVSIIREALLRRKDRLLCHRCGLEKHRLCFYPAHPTICILCKCKANQRKKQP